ncbi:hypothetical protein CJ030_MR3G009817 [Morella rubra]|uniref:Uncharacterized protein n=1 Tax=Morella rubra TaxID=262757 RepID=A0A6A1W8H0_9ROSI|nr:hypothetical protein CJ030_MR3G009817 [Morella rubra]
MEFIVRNVPITFSPNKLARFLNYERDLTSFSNLPLIEDGRPTKTEVFQMMLGEDTIILDGSYMIHWQLRPFWWIMHLILCSNIDPKKHTAELSYVWAEFMYLISLPYGILLTEFLHVIMVPKGVDEPEAIPLGAINKTMLSKSLAQARQALNATRRLEEARLQIEEMRARQLEYEALLVKQSDMEQTMEEQQRKKNEEHQKMMQEQQRNLGKQQEQRIQLIAEQMHEQLMEKIRQLQSRSTPKRKFG